MKSVPHFAIVLVALSLLGADAKSDDELLQGEWREVAREHEGKKISLKGKAAVTYHFRSGVLDITVRESKPPLTYVYSFRYGFGTTLDDDNKAAHSYEIDPSKNPKEINIVPDSDFSRKGIYKLEGDTLTLCYTEGVYERPAEFRTTAGNESRMVTLVRTTSGK